MKALTGNSDQPVSHAVRLLTRYPEGVVVVEMKNASRYAYGPLRNGDVLVREQSDSVERMELEAERFSKALAVDRGFTGRLDMDEFVLAAQRYDPSTAVWHSGGGIMLVRRDIDAETMITAADDTAGDYDGGWWFVIDRDASGWNIWPRPGEDPVDAFDRAVRAYRERPSDPASTEAGAGMRWELW